MRQLIVAVLLILILFAACSPAEKGTEATFTEARKAMVEKLIKIWEVSDPGVIAAMEEVPPYRLTWCQP